MPPIVCIVGKKNSGKTTLAVALAAELDRRGYTVMTIKHGHGFEVDRKGTDSWRHRHEGQARRVILAGPDGFAVLGEWPSVEERKDPQLLASRYLSDADIVLVEGYHRRSGLPKIEVIRGGSEEAPWFDPAGTDRGSEPFAIVTDIEELEARGPVFRLGSSGLIAALADWVEATVFPRRRCPVDAASEREVARI
jgi:molybdopterin-guanine dinucleotide biosynthesis protein B